MKFRWSMTVRSWKFRLAAVGVVAAAGMLTVALATLSPGKQAMARSVTIVVQAKKRSLIAMSCYGMVDVVLLSRPDSNEYAGYSFEGPGRMFRTLVYNNGYSLSEEGFAASPFGGPYTRGPNFGFYTASGFILPLGYHPAPASTSRMIQISWWMLIAVVGVGSPIPFVVACLDRWRRRRLPGTCRHCGYDIRATPLRCPECGVEAVTVGERIRA